MLAWWQAASRFGDDRAASRAVASRADPRGHHAGLERSRDRGAGGDGAGWWQADPLAALIIVAYALREAREIFRGGQ
jgi:hypothetical protein